MMPIDPLLIVLILFAIFVIWQVKKGFKIIRQAETMVIERLGKYSRTLNSGINIVWPIIETVREIDWRYEYIDVQGNKGFSFKRIKTIDLRETVHDFPKQPVITKDNVQIFVDAILYFQIIEPVKVVYEINNLPNALEKLTQTSLRNVVGELTLDGCLTSRDQINGKLLSILDETTDKWGVKVNRVELQDITPPKTVKAAMEQEMEAERKRRADILEAEGKKQASILEAEGYKASKINKAQGEKEALILEAEGRADATVKEADAEKQKIDLISAGFKGKKDDPANYIIALNYIETLEKMVSGENNKVVYMPYEATGVLSSIGGIKEMLEGVKK